jgi:hypothetical protein
MIIDPPRKLGLRAFWGALWDRPRSLMFGAWFTIFPLLLLIPFYLLMSAFVSHQPNHKKISANGLETNAEVIKIATVHNVQINGTNPKRVFFRYTLNGNSKQASMDTLSIDEISDWKPGRLIAIRYLGNEATIPSLEPAYFPFFIFLLVPLLFWLIGLPSLAFCIVGAKNRLKIMKLGVVKKARLLSLAPIYSLPPIYSFAWWFLKTRFEATYVFQDASGNQAFGASLTTDLMLLNEKKKDDEIEILVLPTQETKSLILDAPLLRKLQSARYS